MNAQFSAGDVGIADQLTLWCEDCGHFVGRRQLQKLVVFEEDRVEVVDLPMVPMHDDVWGEA